jgi:hypothetical protein
LQDMTLMDRLGFTKKYDFLQEWKWSQKPNWGYLNAAFSPTLLPGASPGDFTRGLPSPLTGNPAASCRECISIQF